MRINDSNGDTQQVEILDSTLVNKPSKKKLYGLLHFHYCYIKTGVRCDCGHSYEYFHKTKDDSENLGPYKCRKAHALRGSQNVAKKAISTHMLFDKGKDKMMKIIESLTESDLHEYATSREEMLQRVEAYPNIFEIPWETCEHAFGTEINGAPLSMVNLVNALKNEENNQMSLFAILSHLTLDHIHHSIKSTGCGRTRGEADYRDEEDNNIDTDGMDQDDFINAIINEFVQRDPLKVAQPGHAEISLNTLILPEIELWIKRENGEMEEHLHKVRSQQGYEGGRINIREFYLALGEQCRALWTERKHETQAWRTEILEKLQIPEELEKFTRYIANNEERIYPMEGNGGARITEAFEVSVTIEGHMCTHVSETVVNRTEKEAVEKLDMGKLNKRSQDGLGLLVEQNACDISEDEAENILTMLEKSKAESNFPLEGESVKPDPVTTETEERKPRKRLKKSKNVDEKITEEIQDNIAQLQKQCSDNIAGQRDLSTQMAGLSNSMNDIMRMLQAQASGENAASKKTKKKKRQKRN